MWLSALKLAVCAGSKIYANKQKTKMAMSDAQLMHAARMAKGVEAYQGKLAVTPREKRLAAQYGDKKRITRGDVITIAKKKSGEEPMRDRMKQPLKRKKP